MSYLLTTKNGIYVDGTLGGGGHAAAILDLLDHNGSLIGIDLDDDAIIAASKRLEHYGKRIAIIKENFKNIKFVLSQREVKTIHGVLLDLGVSSFQLDEPRKGFSFRANAQLDMRMDHHQQLDAKYVINQYDEHALSYIIWKYGEERHSRRIAKVIVRQREQQPIESTGQLVAVINQAVKGKFLNKTLARTFQAIRIEVNNEMENLQQALYDCIDVLEPGGRIVVISYHSLEDRIVKETFRSASAKSISSGNKLIPDIPLRPTLQLLTRKPIAASRVEIAKNPRARSARLRAVEKI